MIMHRLLTLSTIGFKSILNRRHEHLLKQITKDPSMTVTEHGGNPYLLQEECKRMTNQYRERTNSEYSPRSASCSTEATSYPKGHLFNRWSHEQENARLRLDHLNQAQPFIGSNSHSSILSADREVLRSDNAHTTFEKFTNGYRNESENSEISEGKTRLSGLIKDVNRRFINTLESQYSESNKKHSRIALQLAEVYIKGKRVPKNLFRAVEILSDSVLAEAKFMLVKLALETGDYSDAFHYLEYFSHSKCNCVDIKVRQPQRVTKGKGPLKAPNPSIAALEQNKPKCFKHLCESLKSQIIEHLGAKEASKRKREGSSLYYHARNYSASSV